MLTYFFFHSNPWLLPIVAAVVLGLLIELPFRFGKPLMALSVVKDDAWGSVQAGILTLSAFVVSLSFAQASARYDSRRELVVTEANAIGTTWLRAAQLPVPQALQFRRVLTDYAVTRLHAYESGVILEQLQSEVARSDRDQATLWSILQSAMRAQPGRVGLSMLMQSLNGTIDVSAEQRQALTSHVPTAMLMLMLVLVALGTLSIGMRCARDESRPAALSTLYVIACAVVITMCVDYDRPQSGPVRIDFSPLSRQVDSMRP